MTAIVLDSSAILPLFLRDESDTYSQAVLQEAAEGARLLSLSLCLSEFGNTIGVAIRRGRLTEAQAAYAHRGLFLLPVEFQAFVDSSTMALIHGLAQRHRLSFYDASYLALAINEGARIASLDDALKDAAKAEGVVVV